MVSLHEETCFFPGLPFPSIYAFRCSGFTVIPDTSPSLINVLSSISKSFKLDPRSYYFSPASLQRLLPGASAYIRSTLYGLLSSSIENDLTLVNLNPRHVTPVQSPLVVFHLKPKSPPWMWDPTGSDSSYHLTVSSLIISSLSSLCSSTPSFLRIRLLPPSLCVYCSLCPECPSPRKYSPLAPSFFCHLCWLYFSLSNLYRSNICIIFLNCAFFASQH